MAVPDNDLLMGQEAAEYLRTTPRHLRRLRSQGLECIHIGSKVRYRRVDLDRYIEQCATAGSPVQRSATA